MDPYLARKGVFIATFKAFKERLIPHIDLNQ